MACWENSKSAPTQAVHAAASCGQLLRNAGQRLRLGAKLGAIRGGLVWTAVDAGGIESLSFRAERTPVDPCGHGL